MDLTHGVALLALVAVMTVWVAVQRAWRQTFDDELTDPDALAGRMGCSGCGCVTRCARREPAAAAGGAEQRSIEEDGQ